jgi:hypothetical protein
MSHYTRSWLKGKHKVIHEGIVDTSGLQAFPKTAGDPSLATPHIFLTGMLDKNIWITEYGVRGDRLFAQDCCRSLSCLELAGGRAADVGGGAGKFLFPFPSKSGRPQWAFPSIAQLLGTSDWIRGYHSFDKGLDENEMVSQRRARGQQIINQRIWEFRHEGMMHLRSLGLWHSPVC